MDNQSTTSLVKSPSREATNTDTLDNKPSVISPDLDSHGNIIDTTTNLDKSEEVSTIMSGTSAAQVDLKSVMTSNSSETSVVTSADGMTLCDALRKGLIESRTGKVIDRFSGKSVKLTEAIKRGLINPGKLEVYDNHSKTKVTLKDALDRGLIDEVNGKYDKKMGLQEALKKNFICNPMTLKECDDNELMTSNGQIKDPVSQKNLVISEAIAKGVLDVDLKSVKDVKAGQYVSLSKAVTDGIITTDGKFRDTSESSVMSLQEAVKKGHLTTVSQKSIFDIEGIKDQTSGEYISFNKALEMGIIDKITGKFVEPKSKHKISFKDASEKGFLQPQLLEMLKKPIGIYSADKKRELSLLEAVTEGLIDSNTGLIINTSTMNTIPMDKALQLQLITPMGAAILKSLLNITVTTATVTQTVKRYIQVSSAESDSNAITFQDALRRGLIDDATGIFTHPDTGKELLLDEAIHLGLLKLSPSSSTKSSPVISEIRPKSPKRSISPDKEKRRPPLKNVPIQRKDSKNESLQQTNYENETNTINNSAKNSTNKSSSSSSTNGIKNGRHSSLETNKNGRSSSMENNNKNGRSSSMENGKSSKTSSSLSTTTKSSSTLSRKNSKAGDGFRKIPIVVVGGSQNNNKSTPNSPTKETMPSPTLSRKNIPPSSPVMPRRKSTSLDIPEMPICGWTLKEAIDYRLFDPHTGMYQGDISLGKALEQGLIQYTSVTVATTDEKTGKGITISMKKALESSIITPEGQYNDGRKLISLHDAIMTGKVWHVWKSASQRAKEAAKAKEKKKLDIIEISKGITYNKSTKTFHFAKDITAADLLYALKEGKIRPQDIQVLYGQGRFNIMEALSKGILDKATGVYTSQSEQKMSLLEAILAEYIIIVSAPGIMELTRPQSIDLNANGTAKNLEGSILTLRNGTIQVRIVESGVTTTRISTFMVEVPGTGEEVTLEEAVKRGLISEETASMYQEEVSTDSKVESLIIYVTDPDSGIEMRSEEAIAKGIVTEEEIQELLRQMRDNKKGSGKSTEFQRVTSTCSKRSIASSSSSSSNSNSSSDEADNGSYRSELTIDFGHHTPDVETRSISSVQTNVVFLKQGFVLSGMDAVRNLVTGETMSLYEAKIRGIVSDVKDSKSEMMSHQVKLFITEAISKGLINFSRGTFTNPMNGVEISIGEAIRHGLLITEIHTTEERIDLNAPTISLNEAFQHCFDAQTCKFTKTSTKECFTLQESVDEHWINGQDVIFDVSTNTQRTLDQALKDGLINGQNCDYKVNKQMMFILEAAKQGLVGIFPEAEPEFDMSEVQYTLRESFENGTFNQTTNMFIEFHTKQEITIKQAMKIGLVDFRSAEILNTKTCDYCNLLEAIDQKILNGKTSTVKDLKTNQEMNLSEAYQKGLLRDKDYSNIESEFEVISFWEAIDRDQLDTITGMFYSIHEEKKTMTLEEAIFRKYIDKKSALVKDTWKRKYCSLSEASKKKIIKDGRVMNTTTGKYVNIKEAIRLELIVRDIKNVSLIEMLDFGMYQPHSGRILVPGLDREMSLGEAIDLKLIDHSRTIVKSRVSNRFISLYEAIKVEGVIDSMTGMYASSMNLLEARSKGYLLSVDAMV